MTVPSTGAVIASGECRHRPGRLGVRRPRRTLIHLQSDATCKGAGPPVPCLDGSVMELKASRS